MIYALLIGVAIGALFVSVFDWAVGLLEIYRQERQR